VNGPIVRLYVVVIVLFGSLVFATSWWSVFTRDKLLSNPKNKRELLEEQRIRRGTIKGLENDVLARSIKRRDGTYTRRYPEGRLFSHAVGYSYTTLGRSGLEAARNDLLTGQREELASLIDQLSGKQQEGNDLATSLDQRAQRAAIAGLAGRKGAVVALDPKTGAVKVMASVPDFDPTALRSVRTYQALNRDKDAPLLNRTTQGLYPPGSTFKVVTAVAAIDSGKYTPQSTVSGKNGKVISGVPLNNDFNESFGPIDLTTALTKSVNTVWAEVAEKVGKATMKKYMLRFGFDQEPPIDLPRSQKVPSGVYAGNGRIRDPESSKVDIGRVGIGQERLLVTPLQMAMVASAIANGGRLIKPHITLRATDRDGRIVERIQPEEESRVMSQDTARQVGLMMANVVKEGTGTAAALQGIDVAGKTGTAEKNIELRINQPWFIAFAPVDNPRVAIAATVENVTGGFGGTVAAPIAKRVMEELLRNG
jgi:peptidoglycan glycosyltransferase